MPAAIGYAAASGIPYTEGLIKNRYVHRTFIQPDDNLRQVGIRMKLNPLTSVIKGKRLVVVDDSIVRGNTTRRLVDMLFSAGAAEVHLRISSPPIQWPCFYGIDMATRAELIAANKTRGRDPRPRRRHQPALPHARRPPGQHRPAARPVLPRLLRRRLPHRGARGVRHVQEASTGLPRSQFCRACFDGDYPIAVPEEYAMCKMRFEKGAAAPCDP